MLHSVIIISSKIPNIIDNWYVYGHDLPLLSNFVGNTMFLGTTTMVQTLVIHWDAIAFPWAAVSVIIENSKSIVGCGYNINELSPLLTGQD